jgi:hypothetical protein
MTSKGLAHPTRATAAADVARLRPECNGFGRKRQGTSQFSLRERFPAVRHLSPTAGIDHRYCSSYDFNARGQIAWQDKQDQSIRCAEIVSQNGLEVLHLWFFVRAVLKLGDNRKRIVQRPERHLLSDGPASCYLTTKYRDAITVNRTLQRSYPVPLAQVVTRL